MSARCFNVALDGVDSTGRYRIVYKVVAADEAEAVVLARASAALQDIAVVEMGGIVDLGLNAFEADGQRRVTGQTAKVYEAPGTAGDKGPDRVA